MIDGFLTAAGQDLAGAADPLGAVAAKAYDEPFPDHLGETESVVDEDARP